MRILKNDYHELEKKYAPRLFQKLLQNQMSPYIFLCLILALIQFLFIGSGGRIIPLNVSQAIMLTMIYIVGGLGVGILLYCAGLISFATGAFIGLGSYIAGYIMKRIQVPYILIFIIVAVVAIIFGVVIGFVSLRVKGIGLLIITLALASVMITLYALPNDLTGGPIGISKVPFPKLFMALQTKRNSMYFVILVIMFLLMVVTTHIINSPMGRAMVSLASSETLSQAMGINLLKYRVLAFVIATVYAMFSGVLYISYMQSSVYATWSSALAMNILIAVILGGTARPEGVVLGSFVVFTIDYAFLKNLKFFQQHSQASLFFSGLIIIVIIAKYPGGLIRLINDVKGGIHKLTYKRRVYKYGADE